MVAQLADLGSEDTEYVSMLNSLENEDYSIPKESELRSISSYKTNLSVITLDSSDRLKVRDGCEILEKMLHTLHFTHHMDKTIMKQGRGKIFWPRMLEDLREKYEKWEECREHKPSKAQTHIEIFQ